MDVMKEILNNKDYAIKMRRYFHQYPELSLKEFNTAKVIREQLDIFGIPWVEVANTGTVATLKGNKEKPVVGLRCDIDGLPIKELTSHEFKSKNEGVMHACGHDSHITMLLTAAKVLSEHKDELDCTVKFIFQPGEEGLGGAKLVLASGELDDLTTVAGMHIFPFIEAGKISVDPGPRYTSAGFMKIKIIGKSGHGAMPQHVVDPIYVGAKVVDALQSIVSRETNPLDTLVISVCTFHSGTLNNVFAKTAELTGTVRTFNNELNEQLPSIIERVIKNTCEAYRATYEFEYDASVPATINNPKCSAIAAKSVEKILGKSGVFEFTGIPGGEDFAYMLNRFPGLYAFVGCRNEEKGCKYSLHNEKFDLDEDGMLNGAAFYVQYCLDVQHEF